MRYGILSDIHGNLVALRTVLEAGRRAGVEHWLIAGDVVGYGSHPNECVEAIAQLDGTCVAGNHDLIALGRLPSHASNALVRHSHQWTREQLGGDARAWLERLPATAVRDGIVMAHGSLDDPQEYVAREAAAAAQLRRLAELHPDARTLVLGHTHRFMVFGETAGWLRLPRGGGALSPTEPGRLLLNPASVGQSRQFEPLPRARFMVLEVSGEQRRQIDLRLVPYDLWRAWRGLRAQRLALRSIHSPPEIGRALRRRTRRLLDRRRTRLR